MGITVKNNLTVRGKPSLFHANYTRLLQMSTSDCIDYLAEIARKNPIIEWKEGRNVYLVRDGELSILKDKESPALQSKEMYSSSFSYDVIVEKTQEESGICDDFADSLPVYLRTQMPSFEDEERSFVCEMLIEYIDDRGFLVEEPKIIANVIGKDVEEVIEVLEIIRSVQPGGIGSCNLKDFLWHQCQESAWATVMMERIIYEYLEDIAEDNLIKIRRELALDKKSLDKAISGLRSLRPYPTWGMDMVSPQLQPQQSIRYPDFTYYQYDDGRFVLEAIEPRFALGTMSPLAEPGSHDKAILRKNALIWCEKYRGMEREACELAELMERRNDVILRVACTICDRQKTFLNGEKKHKEPLTLTQIAGELNEPVSTVSRAVKDRTIATPRGTFALKDLLSRPFPGVKGGAISQDYILRRVGDLAACGDGSPSSDREIAEVLRSEGIDIARRTVNKYRRLVNSRSV
jgi:RNA polymerase sigma-54 factor